MTSMDATPGTDAEALYRDLHAHPELGFQEHRTAAMIAQRMRDLGLAVTEGVGGTGVVAELANGPGRTVWLRADMDALPVLEQTGLEYASTATAPGADGLETPVMHACGHDMHVTWLVAAVDRLVRERSRWTGTVVAIFQPAEELIAGAQAMLDDDLVGRFPKPDVVLGQHVGPLPAGVVSLTAGAAMAGADEVDVVLHGRGGHGSRPEATLDPVLAGAMAVVRLQAIVSREVTPGQLAVVTVGQFHAGTKNNIIPPHARLGLNIRTTSAQTRDRILGSIRRIVEGEAAASGMTEPPEIELTGTAPPTINSPDHIAQLRTAFEQAWGEPSVIDYGTVAGSEDVSLLSTASGAPLVFWITGGADPAAVAAAIAADRFEQDIPTNHSPHFAPVLHPTLEHGTDALVIAARTFLA
jgi:amidohydrolase